MKKILIIALAIALIAPQATLAKEPTVAELMAQIASLQAQLKSVEAPKELSAKEKRALKKAEKKAKQKAEREKKKKRIEEGKKKNAKELLEQKKLRLQIVKEHIIRFETEESAYLSRFAKSEGKVIPKDDRGTSRHWASRFLADLKVEKLRLEKEIEEG